jgi:hypothetical protein
VKEQSGTPSTPLPAGFNAERRPGREPQRELEWG